MTLNNVDNHSSEKKSLKPSIVMLHTEDPSPFASQTLPKKALSSTFAFIWHIVKSQKISLTIYQIFWLLISLETLIYGIPMRSFIKALEKAGTRDEIFANIKMPVIFMILAWFLLDVIYRVASIIRSRIVRPNLEYVATRQITNLLMVKPFAFFMEHPSSINNRIIQLTEGCYDFLIQSIEIIIPAIISSFIISISIFLVSPHAGFIISIYATIHITAIVLNLKKYARMSKINALSHNILIRSSLNTVKNMYTVKAFSQEDFESKRLDIFHQRRRCTNIISFSSPEILRIFLAFNSLGTIGIAMVLVLSKLFLDNATTIGDISFVLANSFSNMQLLYGATNELVRVMEDLGRCEEGVTFFHKHIESRELRAPSAEKVVFDRSKGIQFKNVSLQYPNSTTVTLKNQTVTIKDKEAIGVVGLSGSGKTTFVNLVMGYFLPTRGNVLIGGNDTSKVDLTKLRKYITVIPQNYGLFDRTILENIAYGSDNVSFKSIVNAAKKANAHNFISSLKHGYYTSVQDSGANFSGGQRQRIAIARAMLQESPILILDEATSAMDNHTQSLIKISLEKLMKDKTTIIIAHRLETIKEADRILVFKGGRIIEEGTHKFLMKTKDGYYKYLWSLQEQNQYNAGD